MFHENNIYKKGNTLMNAKQYITNLFKQIFTKELLNRLKILIKNSHLEVTANIHSLRKNDAKLFLNNLINCSRIAFTLIVIHGYHHGHVLKDMLANDFDNPHVAEKHCLTDNPGRTRMTICAYGT